MIKEIYLLPHTFFGQEEMVTNLVNKMKQRDVGKRELRSQLRKAKIQ